GRHTRFSRDWSSDVCSSDLSSSFQFEAAGLGLRGARSRRGLSPCGAAFCSAVLSPLAARGAEPLRLLSRGGRGALSRGARLSAGRCGRSLLEGVAAGTAGSSPFLKIFLSALSTVISIDG